MIASGYFPGATAFSKSMMPCGPSSRMHRDERGRLWFPTENGFFILDPADLPVAQTMPAIYIDEVKINGQQLGNQWFFRQKEALFTSPSSPYRIHLYLTQLSTA